MGDRFDVYAYGNEPGGPEAAGWAHFSSLSEAEKALTDYCKNPNRLAIVHKGDGRVIGHLVIKEDSEDHLPTVKELGYIIRADYRRRGYMAEAIRAVLDALFAGGIERVYAGCFCDNVPSRLLIEKLGFAFDQKGLFYAEYCDRDIATYEYVMTRQLWERRKGDK